MQAPVPQSAKALALIATIAAAAPGQQPAPTSTRRFDVVSVKPAGRGQRPPVALDCSPGGFRSTVPLSLVVAFAYDYANLLSDGISGGQDWRAISGTQYDIEARSDQPIGQEECKQMVQHLLAERFKLVLHHEAKEEAVYALVVGRGGPKFREARSTQGNASVSTVNGQPIRSSPLPGAADVPGFSMQQLTALLRLGILRALHSPDNRAIIDRTRLTGVYEIHLEYSLRQDDGRPDIFTAVQEQLGLKLEPRKEPVDVLVVDHVEKPEEN